MAIECPLPWDDFTTKILIFLPTFLVERESAGADKMAEREFALPDVAMELPSFVPDDRWDRGAGPSNLHPFGVEVNTSLLKRDIFLDRFYRYHFLVKVTLYYIDKKEELKDIYGDKFQAWEGNS